MFRMSIVYILLKLSSRIRSRGWNQIKRTECSNIMPPRMLHKSYSDRASLIEDYFRVFMKWSSIILGTDINRKNSI